MNAGFEALMDGQIVEDAVGMQWRMMRYTPISEEGRYGQFHLQARFYSSCVWMDTGYKPGDLADLLKSIHEDCLVPVIEDGWWLIQRHAKGALGALVIRHSNGKNYYPSGGERKDVNFEYLQYLGPYVPLE